MAKKKLKPGTPGKAPKPKTGPEKPKRTGDKPLKQGKGVGRINK